MSKTKTYFIIAAAALALGTCAYAQETGQTSTSTPLSEVSADENITAADLGIQEPKLLPDSPFYFLKNWARSIQSALTFSSVKKAELKLKFASEKLIETEKLVQKDASKVKVIEKAVKSYRAETTALKTLAESIKGTTDSPQIDKLIDKIVEKGVKQQLLLDKLGKEVLPQVNAAVNDAKAQALSVLSEVSLKFSSPQALGEKLTKALEAGKDSALKNLKNLEVLKAIESKVPEQAKDAIKRAQENALKRLQLNLQAMPPEKRTQLKGYIKQEVLDAIEKLEPKSNAAPKPTGIKLPQLKQIEIEVVPDKPGAESASGIITIPPKPQPQPQP